MSKRKVGSFALTHEGYAALKILEARDKDASRKAVVSDALVRAAEDRAGQAKVKFNLPNPTEILLLRADITAEAAIYDKQRKDLLSIRPGSPEAAKEMAAVVRKIDAQVARLTNVDLRLAGRAHLIKDLTPADHEVARQAILWMKHSIDFLNSENGKKTRDRDVLLTMHIIIQKILLLVVG
ncbi:MAG TPA: hypothetical protein VM940_05500 [Chthoniobacterales bacterium]|jgi:hypothetical protein|nr:hypothetical protein [Chthoniobacterales bacterium]